jgi:cell division protein FtsL
MTRIFSFAYTVVFVAILGAFYIARHNRLTELQIKVPLLEKEIRMEEAEKKRLELELSVFFSPNRLEEVARKPEWAHLRPLQPHELFMLDD